MIRISQVVVISNSSNALPHVKLLLIEMCCSFYGSSGIGNSQNWALTDSAFQLEERCSSLFLPVELDSFLSISFVIDFSISFDNPSMNFDCNLQDVEIGGSPLVSWEMPIFDRLIGRSQVRLSVRNGITWKRNGHSSSKAYLDVLFYATLSWSGLVSLLSVYLTRGSQCNPETTPSFFLTIKLGSQGGGTRPYEIPCLNSSCRFGIPLVEAGEDLASPGKYFWKISDDCIPAIASKVPYFVALVAPLGARAIVVKMALVALGPGSSIRLHFAVPYCLSALGAGVFWFHQVIGQLNSLIQRLGSGRFDVPINVVRKVPTESILVALSREKEIIAWMPLDAIGLHLDCTLKDLVSYLGNASDEELEGPMKDQPLSVDASPTALSPGYIANSDPEEDKEDPEEDPADHPADG
ncbi:hypothetical protein Tco_0701674 [Tanacetum coccineum]